MFTLMIETENAAFSDNVAEEVAMILGQVRQHLRRGDIEGRCRDVNGNTVGSWKLEITK